MIAVHQVYKRYGTEEGWAGFCGLDLHIPSGTVAVVVGDTGVGKSALFDLVCANQQPDAGQIEVFGKNLSRLRSSSVALLRRKMGICPQNLELVEDWTALDNVSLPLEINGCSRSDSIAQAAEMLGCLKLAGVVDRLVQTLSQGQRQRIALARSFVHDPNVALLDEPTAHSDIFGVKQVVGLLSRCTSQGGAALITTNDPRLIRYSLVHKYDLYRLASGQLTRERREENTQSPHHSDTHRQQKSIRIQLGVPNVVPFPLTAGGASAE